MMIDAYFTYCFEAMAKETEAFRNIFSHTKLLFIKPNAQHGARVH